MSCYITSCLVLLRSVMVSIVKHQHLIGSSMVLQITYNTYNTADGKNLKSNSGKPQLIYHIIMNLIIFPLPGSACPSSTENQVWFSNVQLACCKTITICCTSVSTNSTYLSQGFFYTCGNHLNKTD